MKITIRTNPEIVIEVDSAKQEKTVELGRVVSDTKISDQEPKPQPAPKLGRVKGGNRCSNCGEAGHRKTTCPSRKPIKKDAKKDDPFDDDLADKIQTMRDEGFSSQYVADDLRLPVETVNRYW